MDLSADELKKSILSLLKLQEIDGLLFNLNEEEKLKPRELAELETEEQEIQKSYKVAERGFRQVERERRSFELRHITLMEDLKKAETKRKEVRNTKEEFSVAKEVENFQKKASDLKKLMEEKENLAAEKKKLVEEAKTKLDSVLEQLKTHQEKYKTRLSEVANEKSELEKRRNEYIETVNDEIFSMYERVQKLRRGSGVALVQSGVCTGCHVTLPPQLNQQLQKLSKLVTCSSCSRILFPANMVEDLGSSKDSGGSSGSENSSSEIEESSVNSSEVQQELKTSNA